MTSTQDNLKVGFAGESQANQKYRAFAKKAEQEQAETDNNSRKRNLMRFYIERDWKNLEGYKKAEVVAEELAREGYKNWDAAYEKANNKTARKGVDDEIERKVLNMKDVGFYRNQITQLKDAMQRYPSRAHVYVDRLANAETILNEAAQAAQKMEEWDASKIRVLR